MEVSAKNPSLCKGCHTSTLRPNWESNNFWPGAVWEGDRYLDEDIKQLTHYKGTSSSRLKKINIDKHLLERKNSFAQTGAFAFLGFLQQQHADWVESM